MFVGVGKLPALEPYFGGPERLFVVRVRAITVSPVRSIPQLLTLVYPGCL